MSAEVLNRYDRIAPFYDLLAKLVFRRSIVDAQLAFLEEIKPESHVLIIGGGTGWLASAILKRVDASITYVDASQAMIARARRKSGNDQRIVFIHGTETSIPAGLKADVLITNFFLDLFDEKELQALTLHLKDHLKPGGRWLVTDFVDHGKWWENSLLAIMYKFFQLTTGLNTSSLVKWRQVLPRHCAVELSAKDFFAGFIVSAVYRIQ